MNKNSKYRKLLDDTRDQICRAEIGVTGVFQLMLETLDKAEHEESKLRAELDAANAKDFIMQDALNFFISSPQVNYGHKELAERALMKTSTQSLAHVQSKAVQDFLIEECPRLEAFKNEEEQEKYHCEWVLYQERERLHEQASKMIGSNNGS